MMDGWTDGWTDGWMYEWTTWTYERRTTNDGDVGRMIDGGWLDVTSRAWPLAYDRKKIDYRNARKNCLQEFVFTVFDLISEQSA